MRGRGDRTRSESRSSSAPTRQAEGGPVGSTRGRRRSSVGGAAGVPVFASASTLTRIRASSLPLHRRLGGGRSGECRSLRPARRGCGRARAARADDSDVVAGLPKCETLLPDAPVRGNGQVLHEHEHPCRVPGLLLAAVGARRRHLVRLSALEEGLKLGATRSGPECSSQQSGRDAGHVYSCERVRAIEPARAATSGFANSSIASTSPDVPRARLDRPYPFATVYVAERRVPTARAALGSAAGGPEFEPFLQR